MKRISNKRRGALSARLGLWAALALGAIVVAGIGYAAFKDTATSKTATARVNNIPTFEVRRGPMSISVTESGNVRPREQIILRNEMDDDTKIISIVDEGARVKKGDLLVKLDATEVEDQLLERRLRVQNSEAEYISSQENLEVVKNQAQADIDKAELDYEFAQQDLKKYLEGEYPNQLKAAEAEISLAEEELVRAQEELKWSKVLHEEKYMAESDLKQDELAAKKAELDLELARQDLELLKNFTHKRQLAQLRSDVRQTSMALERARRKARADVAEAEARLKYRTAEVEEEKAEVKELEREIEYATIHAPIDGMVLYASSVSDDWRDDDPPIDAGNMVDEEGEIIYLPTENSFNIDVKVPESSLNKVEEGLPVKILVDALPGMTFWGEVIDIARLPDSRRRWLNPDFKVYNTEIEIEGTGDGKLRNGMSCQAEIIVAEYEDALYIPIQCVVRRGSQALAYVLTDQGAVERPIEVGLDNNRMVHVKEGLQEGETVLLEPPLSSGEVQEGTRLSAGATSEQQADREDRDERQRRLEATNEDGTEGDSNRARNVDEDEDGDEEDGRQWRQDLEDESATGGDMEEARPRERRGGRSGGQEERGQRAE